MQRIIYKNTDNSVCIIAPATDCGLSIEEIAQNDVPAGTPYDIVDASDPRAIPSVTTEQLFSALRAARDAKLRDNYDPAIARLARQQRLATTDEARAAIAAKIAAWDAYAVALCNLPAQPGAPWDGGGELTPWPEMPSVG